MSSAHWHPTSKLPLPFHEQLSATSLFASPDFLSIWQTRGGKGGYWLYEAGGVTTLLPGVEFGNGILTRFQSLPDGLYSRPFSFRDGLLMSSPQEHCTAILAAIAKHSYLKTWLYDYSHLFAQSVGYVATDCETNVIDISLPDWEPPDTTLRSEIRKADRESIQIEPFNWEQHSKAFLLLMRNTEIRHGRNPKYSAEFFEALAQFAQKDSRVIWKHCTYQQEAAASHIFFIEGSLALHWQVYFDKAFSHLKSNQAILFQAIRELQQRGVKLLSLGASPSDAEGLRSYKERWGGKPYRYTQLHRKSWLGKLI